MSDLRDALNAANGGPGATAQDVGRAMLDRIDIEIEIAVNDLRMEFLKEVKVLQGQINDLRLGKG
jgi:hypothetical protein